ncbi:unnamed protein product [Prunus armeniaca]
MSQIEDPPTKGRVLHGTSRKGGQQWQPLQFCFHPGTLTPAWRQQTQATARSGSTFGLTRVGGPRVLPRLLCMHWSRLAGEGPSLPGHAAVDLLL